MQRAERDGWAAGRCLRKALSGRKGPEADVGGLLLARALVRLEKGLL